MILDLGDRRNEAIAACRDRLYEFGLTPAIFKNLSQGGDVPGKSAFFDEAIAPHQLHQFVFFDNAPGIRDQHQESIDSFGSEWNYFRSAE